MDYRKSPATLQKRLGFEDPDLLTPAHDDMVLWIGEHLPAWAEEHYDNSAAVRKAQEKFNAELIRQAAVRMEKLERERERFVEMEMKRRQLAIAAEYRKQPAVSVSMEVVKTHRDWLAWVDTQPPVQLPEVPPPDTSDRDASIAAWRRLAENGLTTPEPLPPVVSGMVYEEPVSTDRDFIVGFVDVAAVIELSVPMLAGVDWEDRRRGTWYLSDYADLTKIRHDWSEEYVNVSFEAKPAIKSLGELLRQLRTYKNYQGQTRFVVVSPDVRYRDHIIGQGFGFWECPRF